MQTIYLDISSKGIIPTIYAKQGDVGRKFLAVINDAGVPCSLSGVALSVWYEGESGEGNYTDIGNKSAFSVNGNNVYVELITQMLTNAGDGVLCLALNEVNGGQIASWNINYSVEAVPGAASEEAEAYYTAFSKAVDSLPYIESAEYPGCYYRTVDGTVEWINPPMILGIEYRTTERNNGKVVYAKSIDFGLSANGKVIAVSGFIMRYAGRLGDMALPYTPGSLTGDYAAYFSVNDRQATLFCGTNVVNINAYLQTWYTKE